MSEYAKYKKMVQDIKCIVEFERLSPATRAIVELCNLIYGLIGSIESEKCTTNIVSTETWADIANYGHPSMAEGYPCPPGTKILAINQKTGEFKITRFDPNTLSRDWLVAIRETDLMAEQHNIMLNNLLAQLGWFKYGE